VTVTNAKRGEFASYLSSNPIQNTHNLLQRGILLGFEWVRRYRLYDVPNTTKDGEITLIDLPRGVGKVFDPDPAEQAITGEWGICVDVDSSYNQGCPDQTMSAVMDGVIGCMDRRVSYFLCGLEVDIMDGDSSTAAIKGNLLYMPERVLVAAGEDLDGDGQATPAITCKDPIDCNQVRTRQNTNVYCFVC